MKLIITRGDQKAVYQQSSREFLGDAELIDEIELLISVTARIGSDPYLMLSQNPHLLGVVEIEYVPDTADQQLMDA